MKFHIRDILLLTLFISVIVLVLKTNADVDNVRSLTSKVKNESNARLLEIEKLETQFPYIKAKADLILEQERMATEIVNSYKRIRNKYEAIEIVPGHIGFRGVVSLNLTPGVSAMTWKLSVPDDLVVYLRCGCGNKQLLSHQEDDQVWLSEKSFQHPQPMQFRLPTGAHKLSAKLVKVADGFVRLEIELDGKVILENRLSNSRSYFSMYSWQSTGFYLSLQSRSAALFGLEYSKESDMRYRFWISSRDSDAFAPFPSRTNGTKESVDAR